MWRTAGSSLSKPKEKGLESKGWTRRHYDCLEGAWARIWIFFGDESRPRYSLRCVVPAPIAQLERADQEAWLRDKNDDPRSYFHEQTTTSGIRMRFEYHRSDDFVCGVDLESIRLLYVLLKRWWSRWALSRASVKPPPEGDAGFWGTTPVDSTDNGICRLCHMAGPEDEGHERSDCPNRWKPLNADGKDEVLIGGDFAFGLFCAMEIRDAAAGDIPAITAIYASHVLHGTGTFEEIPPSESDMLTRMEGVQSQGWPWLVAEDASGVLGYAYFAQFRPRSAYRHTAENAIYVRADAQRRGVGGALLRALLERAEKAGFRQILAVIGDSGNAGSIGLHGSLGFRHVGVFKSVGLKFGRWLDVVMMQKELGEGHATMPS